jgi:hypothetical protein
MLSPSKHEDCATFCFIDAYSRAGFWLLSRSVARQMRLQPGRSPKLAAFSLPIQTGAQDFGC